MRSQILLRQINPPSFRVFSQVAEDVGQLKGDAGALRVGQGLLMSEAPNMNATQTDSRRHAVAVLIQIVKRGIGSSRKIHLNAVKDLVQILSWNLKSLDRIDQSWKERAFALSLQSG